MGFVQADSAGALALIASRTALVRSYLAKSQILRFADLAGALSLVLVVLAIVRRYRARKALLPLPPSPPHPIGQDHLAIMPKEGFVYIAYDKWMKELGACIGLEWKVWC